MHYFNKWPANLLLFVINRLDFSIPRNCFHEAWQRWCTPLVPVLRRQRQAGLCEFKACLIYKASSRTAWVRQRTLLKTQTNKKRELIQ